ncbi:hypothetical protein O7635_11640 [Asanoa sp. WMMD1127]|uniref:hypothetical protein n=1 Tax=Asanoa sp. WMMD1127 TaxID=3016107 RepID=UPI002416C750|nr:hypothetical protein [Asanoa sp. WMMD1127]MDG4822502.1 hypothetical protein [Asanoa sp. WMMD1127]
MSGLRDSDPPPADRAAVLLTGAALILGVAADVQAFLPLEKPGGLILLAAVALAGFTFTTPAGRHVRVVLAGMTALVLASLWFGYRIPEPPAPAPATATSADGVDGLARDRDLYATQQSRGATRRPDDDGVPDARLFSGQGMTLSWPMEGAELELTADRLVGGRVLLAVVRNSCATADASDFVRAIPLTDVEVDTTICLRTTAADSALLITDRSTAGARYPWLEFRLHP